ncbi:MAG: serine hydrolase domain-containing protein [Chloroflexota bacterium]
MRDCGKTTMTELTKLTETYSPPPESQGGWRWLRTPEDVREIGGMDPRRLTLAAEFNALQASTTSSVVVIRRGWLVGEWYEVSALATTRYDIWSATKSLTSTAYGLLFDERRDVGFETPAYEHIPEGHPLSDARKARLTFRHLLTMTSGIPGESIGIGAVPTSTGVGPFEAALGFAPCWARRWGEERWANRLAADPGTRWDYSDPAFAHLGIAFTHLAGQQMRDFLQERVFGPIGIESLSWDLQGVGTRFGPHTNAHTGVHVSARELARIGYLMLHRGAWSGRQILPPAWVQEATRSSQDLNRNYGLAWWVNTPGTLWPTLPRDTFAAMGLHRNECYVIPSLELVVVRTGYGPVSWAPEGFIGHVVGAVLDRDQRTVTD